MFCEKRSLFCWLWKALLIAFLAALFTFTATSIVNTVDYKNSDFFTFWLSGRLASEGQNPYDRMVWIEGHQRFGTTWIPNETFIYPMPVSFFFLPLGMLPLQHAYIVWDVLLQFMILLSILIVMKNHTELPAKPYFLPVIAGAFLFRPTIVLLLNGQFTGLLLLLITLTIVLWEKGKWEWGAVLLPLLALKPNLGMPLIALLAFYLLRQGKIKSLITAAVSGLLLLILGWIQNPNWVAEFWHAGVNKISQIFGYAPTIWGASAILCKQDLGCALGYGASFTMIFLTVYLYLVIRKISFLTPALVTCFAVVIMLLVTPSSWPYDQVLLIAPIVTITLSMRKKGYPYLPAALVFLGIDILAWGLLGIAMQIEMDFLSVLVPLSVFGLLIWTLREDRPMPQAVAVG